MDEEELIEVLQEYFTNVLKQKKKVIAHVVNEFQRVYKAKDENVEYEKELNAELAKLQKTRQKYMDMYTDDLISREELNEKIGGSRQEMERIENELKLFLYLTTLFLLFPQHLYMLRQTHPYIRLNLSFQPL